MTYEHAISEIKRIIEELENGNQEIESITANVKYAMKLINFCKNKLYSIENELNATLSELSIN
ncbi:MAG: exodeoxyribonuclease VII small subunit [Prevotellaceae bacterium]|jgi:exodeoxyribonuclease VII small subunit|nr:exodeoxyribonuclease VII small subunit [Prevotellaceae bacterium]